MALRPILPIVLLAASGLAARAGERTVPDLPMLAANPQPRVDESSIWSGLYVGTELFGVVRRGGGGGAGGGGFVGYAHEFENNVVLGVQGNAGYSPGWVRGVNGFNYASTTMKVGYDMGRFMPFLTAGVGIAKSYGFNYNGVQESLNNLFDSSSNLRAFTTVGAGVDYAITDKLHVGVAVSVGTAGGGASNPWSLFPR